MFSKRVTYFDYAATTPLDPRVLRVVRYAEKRYANPSSIHTQGVRARKILNSSREKIARLAQVKEHEVFFTSGGTESNNLAILGIISAYTGKDIPHIITTRIEHPAVLEVCKYLEKTKQAEVTYLTVNGEGFVSPQEIKDSLQKNTVLVTVMQVNNEIGTIQPLSQIARVIQAWKKQEGSVYPYFHTDASQGPCYLDFHREKLGVDMLTLDGLKVYGPKGVGLLIKKDGVVLSPIMYGGGQEKGLRSGTENLPGIVGLAEALTLADKEREEEIERLGSIRDFLIEEILSHHKQASLNGSYEDRVANNVNICFEGVDAEFLVILLDQKGFSVSFSSSCRTQAENATSYVVEALNRKECAGASIRITLGRYTTKRDAKRLLKALKECLPKARNSWLEKCQLLWYNGSCMMEDLNKQQLILLVLLVSFVTSIATGIITASLLDKAPVAVTQTVNRVVERTVETVVPDNLEPEERVVTVRETVVVTEDDRVVEAISKNRKHVVRIFVGDTFITMGFIVDASGEVVTPFGDFNSLPEYTAYLDGGEEVPVRFLRDNEEEGTAYFRLGPEDERTFSSASTATEGLQLGQTIVAISGRNTNNVATGRVTEVSGGESIVTDLNTTSFQIGTILINLSGDIVGMYNRGGQFVPARKFIAVEASEDTVENTASASQAVE